MNEKGATVEGLKLAQTLIMTSRGTPLLYYGDELAMPRRRRPRQPARFSGRIFRRRAQRFYRRGQNGGRKRRLESSGSFGQIAAGT